jgi:lipopolysaccharide transport system ATP-binding protein
MSEVIALDSVSKKYLVQLNRPLTLQESFIRWLKRQNERISEIWALRDISFSVEEGQALGVIGHNGAGKSTLLRLLCGLGRPTSGHIRVKEQISSLLELGTGFHPEMTGRENIMTGCLLNNLSYADIKERQDEIINFAELEEFIDMPVRTYSTGMYMRLAFSIAMNLNPGILVVDEVLSVGDYRFQQKCVNKLRSLRKDCKTLIISSHDTDQLKKICNELLLLDEGKVVIKGEPDNVVSCYHELMRLRTARRAAMLRNKGIESSLENYDGDRFGTQEASISSVRVYDASEKIVNTLHSGDSLTIKLEYSRMASVSDMAFTLGIYNDNDFKCFETHIPSMTAEFGPLRKRCSFSCRLDSIPLLPGKYFINIGLYPIDKSYIYDCHWELHPVTILDNNEDDHGLSGVVSMQPVWSLLG